MNDVQMVVSSLYNQSRIAAANPAMAERLQLQMISKLNQVVNNKAILENAVKQATDNDGFNEYAITTSGQLIVMDAKGKIN
jgi:hypothetical protein